MLLLLEKKNHWDGIPRMLWAALSSYCTVSLGFFLKCNNCCVLMSGRWFSLFFFFCLVGVFALYFTFHSVSVRRMHVSLSDGLLEQNLSIISGSPDKIQNRAICLDFMQFILPMFQPTWMKLHLKCEPLLWYFAYWLPIWSNHIPGLTVLICYVLPLL